MKTFLVSQLDAKEISPGVEWIDIVTQKDAVGFTEHEVRIHGKGALFTMNNKEHSYNHIYYILYGNCKVQLSDQSVYHLEKDSLLAVPHNVSGTIQCEENVKLSKILVFYSQPDMDRDGDKLAPLIFNLQNDIVGTARDVDWGRGHSRRFLSQPDGFNISVHHTFSDPRSTIDLQYLNNIECNYVLSGKVKCFWNDEKESVEFNQEEIEDGDGLIVFLDKNDQHRYKTFNEPVHFICAFYPPLKGTEVHNLDGEGPSSY